jgi:hypothetical protein
MCFFFLLDTLSIDFLDLLHCSRLCLGILLREAVFPGGEQPLSADERL